MTWRADGLAPLIVAGCLAASGVAAWAQSGSRAEIQSARPWAALTAPQKAALAPLERDWAGIDASRQSKWLEIANRFPSLPADEQQRLHARMAEWARLSPAERGRARLSYQEAKQLPPEERQARWQAYQALPPEQREALAARSAPAARAPRPEPAASANGAKRNIVGNASLAAAPAKPVAPTLVQAKPGATTTLITSRPEPPLHQQTGLPKIAAAPGFVDRTTMLPKRGPQGAAAVRPPAAASTPTPPTAPAAAK